VLLLTPLYPEIFVQGLRSVLCASQAAKYAEDCLDAAAKTGITKDEIEEDCGNLVDHMSWAIEDANDAEVAKRAQWR
jgi:hypothetical protein